MKKNFFAAVLIFIFFTLLFGIAYPFTVTFLANQIFPKQAEGSLIVKDDKILGSKLIGQNFSEPKYFWGRLSATSPHPYNAAASSGSNLDLASKTFEENVNKRIELLKKYDPDNSQQIPIDLVTSSASGLDPEISVDAASYQIKRVAKFRNITEFKVEKIVKKYTYRKQVGLFGENRVNILQVNLELDK